MNSRYPVYCAAPCLLYIKTVQSLLHKLVTTGPDTDTPATRLTQTSRRSILSEPVGIEGRDWAAPESCTVTRSRISILT